MTERKPVDWEFVERHYRAGILSLRQICAEHLQVCGSELTEGAIRKRAKRDGWERNLKAKIQARVEELVRKEAVRTPSTQLSPADERDVVEANARLGVAVQMRQRQDADRMRKLAAQLMTELELETDNYPEFAELGELLRTEDDRGQDKRNDIYNRAISLGGRIDNAKKLVEILEKLQKIENEAYGLGQDDEKSNPIDDLLRRVAAGEGA